MVHSDEDLTARVRACYGAVRLRDLKLDRTERRHVQRLVDRGELVGHPHGVVSLPEAARPVVLARIHGGLLTCQQAAAYYGYPLTVRARHDHRIHIAVPDGHHFAPVDGEVLHVERSVKPCSPTDYPVAPVTDALARYLRCHPSPENPLMACDAALHHGHATAEDVAARLRGPGARRALARLALASPRARSPLETLTRRQLHKAGIPFEDGVLIPQVGEVDILVGGYLVLELDGYTYHVSKSQFGLDRWRDRMLLRMGYRVARFTRQDVEAGVIADEVRELLRSQDLTRPEMSKLLANDPICR